VLSIKPRPDRELPQSRYVYALPERKSSGLPIVIVSLGVAAGLYLLWQVSSGRRMNDTGAVAEKDSHTAIKKTHRTINATSPRREFPDPPPPQDPSSMSEQDWATRNMLVTERKAAIDNLRHEEEIADLLMPLSGYSERVEAYCVYRLSHANRLAGGDSLPYLRSRYAALIAAKPQTAEAESQRQLEIRVIEKRMVDFEENLRACEGMSTNGGQALKTNEQLVETIKGIREHIADLDRTLVKNGQAPAR
jgi:hypothetical protein